MNLSLICAIAAQVRIYHIITCGTPHSGIWSQPVSGECVIENRGGNLHPVRGLWRTNSNWDRQERLSYL